MSKNGNVVGALVATGVLIIMWLLSMFLSIGVPVMVILWILDAVKLINIW